jgi:hypothetical protein
MPRLAAAPAALAAVLLAASPALAGDAPKPKHNQRDEDLTELRQWEALQGRLERAAAAHDAAAIEAIDREVAGELAQEKLETEEELKKLVAALRQDARQDAGVTRARAEAEHRERLDRARLEAVIVEWAGLRGHLAPGDLARRAAVLSEIVAQARREVAGGKGQAEEGPGTGR